jgi:hypothetical protein
VYSIDRPSPHRKTESRRPWNAPRDSSVERDVRCFAAWLLSSALWLGCGAQPEVDGLEASAARGEGSAATAAGDADRAPARDEEYERCEARWAELAALPTMPGAPAFDAQRVAFLGRARGANTLFVDTPAPGHDATLSERARLERARTSRERPGVRIARLVGRLPRDRAALRSILLREGYLYADDPLDAYELSERVTLVDLFDEPVLRIERGETELRLVRHGGRWPSYEVTRGPGVGSVGRILFGDRVSVDGEARAPALHRDVKSFAEREGVDRLELVHLGSAHLLARLRFGEQWARGVVRAEGARLTLECLAEPREVRERVTAALAESASRRRSLGALREAIRHATEEALPFDRPREVKGPDRDGELRPYWMSAYLAGRQSFVVEEKTYAVFDHRGRPAPPTVCMDFALECFERASGRWFRPRGEHPGRSAGRLDWDALGIENRRGVMGFLGFARKRPDLFGLYELPAEERVPFAQRERYFAALLRDDDRFRPGDVLAIQGIKADGRVHQHAILLEGLDPLTGFPSELADQMRITRRRSWEAIMAEAPKRSLLYRARPKPELLALLDPESEAQAPTTREASLQR